jgi:uncharacterized protein YyaL (SSP411 family)
MNRLINSTSPYLLQHAYNPVDWFEWGPESLQKAVKEDKPILVSIGYSSCHWCHVMERESFEHDDIAQIMNENFVCIKVDREERPDVDQVYMDAVQAMGMNGGWPLNVFLTPDQKPFYGGTYFPPRNWAALLINIGKAYKERKEEILESAEEIKNHLNTSDLQRFAKSEGTLELKEADKMFNVLQAKYDSVYGGLDKAPKFVMPSIWEFLLHYYYITENKQALNMVEHTLTMISCGGIFDQIGGGFARYSVDGQWFAPHFEKMLYDNGQLLSLYAQAFTITKNPLFKETIEKTVDWLEREMTHPKGGFYSALDADSEGVEGKFYAWTYDEFKETIGGDVEVAAAWFNVKPSGTWEHGQNILTRPDAANEFATAHKVSIEELDALIRNASIKLFAKRSTRIRPGLDDKILLGWNAMMIVGLVDASLAINSEKALTMAINALRFLENKVIENGKIYRSFKEKHSATEGFLEDYAFLIQAYIKLYQATLDEAYLQKAKQWNEYMLLNFYDSTDGYFHFSSKASEKLIARKKEIFDNVIPSGNSVMARNLLLLHTYFEIKEWGEIALNMIAKLAAITSSETAYMANWGMAYLEAVNGFEEIAISGKDFRQLRKDLGQHFLPLTIFAGSDGKSNLPLLEGREPKDQSTLIYVCQNKTCRLPVKQVDEALVEIQKMKKG